MAMSVPAPMAIPTFALVSAGASFMPSPTIPTLPFLDSFLITASLPSGFCNSFTALAESSFIVSATAIIPSNSPSLVNSIGVFPCSENSSAFSSTSPETENFPETKSTLPPNISQSSILPVRPFPTSA